MRCLEAARAAWAPQRTTGQRHQYAADPPAGARIVDDDTTIVDETTGELIAFVTPIADNFGVGALVDRLAKIKWSNANEFRLSGFNNAHRTFGYSAPVPLRRRWGCAPCGFNREEPEVAQQTARVASELWRLFELHAPERAKTHDDLVRQAIHPDWLWGQAPWTSGIVNRTASLPYHRDAGNLKDAWSGQLVLRRRATGGYLHLPECDLYLRCANRSALVFAGQANWHGVTPITATDPRSYRYSMVFYAKAGCRDCGPAADEPHRAALARTAREESDIIVS